MPSTTKSRAKSGKKSSTSHLLTLSTPHAGGQRAVYQHPARFQIVACGRRWGKTEVGKNLAARCALRDAGHVAWVSPTAKMAGAVWRIFLDGFSNIADWVSVQEKTIILKNGGKLTFWTAENEDALRGQAFDLVIMDEAAMYRSANLWQAVVRPALSDRLGKAFFLSTPRGRNWFWDLYLKGDASSHSYSENYQSWNFPSNSSPYFITEEFEEARDNLPERFFRQEYLAEFLIDGGEVFKGVMPVSVLDIVEEAYEGNFVFGIDLGKENDWTVISVIDADKREQVDLYRIKEMTWKDQREEIWKAYRKWKPSVVVVEKNSAGSPIIESLNDEGMYAEPFYTTNDLKKEIIDQLSLDIEKGNIKLINDLIQISELQAYQMNRTPTGKVKYNSPYGTHDDTVMALAIANYTVVKNNVSFGSAIPIIA